MTNSIPLVGRRLVESVIEPFRTPSHGPAAHPPGLRYRDLDIWRGVACLMVLIYHTSFDVADREMIDAWRQAVVTGNWSQSGLSWSDCILAFCDQFWIGVPLFFVISGYCIAASADRTMDRRRSVGDFLLRRVVRIYPPLWIYLAGGFFVVAVLHTWLPNVVDDPERPLPPIQEFSWWQIGGSITLTETWRHHLIGDAKHPLFLHIWTLCYEEQFYLVTAMVMLLFGRRVGLGMAVVTLMTTSLMVIVMAKAPEGRLSVLGFFFDGHWMQFAAGAAVYFACKNRNRLLTAGLVTMLLAGIAMHIRDMPERFYQDETFSQGSMTAYGFALLLMVMHRFDGTLSRFIPLIPIGAVGRMCYSVYLTHWPLTTIVSKIAYGYGMTDSLTTLAVTFPMSILLCMLVGTAFYFLVERHCLMGPGTDPKPDVAEGLSFAGTPRPPKRGWFGRSAK